MGPKELPQLPTKTFLGHIDAPLWPLIVQSHETLGDAFALRLFHQYIAVFASPEAHKAILISHHQDMSARLSFGPMSWMLGQGLARLDGAEHQSMRRLVLPHFHQQVIRRSLNAMSEITLASARDWISKGRVHAIDDIRMLTLNIMMHVLFSQNANTSHQALSAMLNQLFDCLLINPQQPRSFLGFSHMLRLPLVKNLRWRLDRYLKTLITHHQGQEDILGMLKATRLEGKALSYQAIRDQLLTFLVAGHDTTAMALMWILYLLAKHPHYHAALRDEGAQSGQDNFKARPLLAAVIKESMRLYPPIALGIRQARKKLEIAGYEVTKGSMVMYAPYFCHRDERFWPEPERFCPERFLTTDDLSYRYLPFGAGAHHCIGKGFAELELKTILSTLVKHFDWHIEGDTAIQIGLRPTLSPLGQLYFCFTPRAG